VQFQAITHYIFAEHADMLGRLASAAHANCRRNLRSVLPRALWPRNISPKIRHPPRSERTSLRRRRSAICLSKGSRLVDHKARKSFARGTLHLIVELGMCETECAWGFQLCGSSCGRFCVLICEQSITMRFADQVAE